MENLSAVRIIEDHYCSACGDYIVERYVSKRVLPWTFCCANEECKNHTGTRADIIRDLAFPEWIKEEE